MTRDEILTMPAGPELDALVAEKVMGWRHTIGETSHKGRVIVWPLPDRSGVEFSPSIDIAAAFQVLKSLHWQWEIGYDPAGWGTVEIAVWRGGEEDGDWERIRTTFDRFEDMERAICHAVLLAVECAALESVK